MTNLLRKSLENLLNCQIQSLKNLKPLIREDILSAVRILARVKGKLVVLGVGKSGYVAMKTAATLTSLGIPSVFIHAGEAAHGDLGLIGASDGCIAISNSGKTREILKITTHIKRHFLPLVSITGNKNSELAKMSDVILSFKIKDEGSPFGIAPMSSTIATLAIGDMLATALSIKNGFSKNDFADIHPGGSLGLQLNKVSDVMVKGDGIPLVNNSRSFPEALKEISSKKLGIVGVVNNRGQLIGSITDGDVRRSIITGGLKNNIKLSMVMSKKPKTIKEIDSLYSALSVMELNKITSLFVVSSKGKPVGIIHMHQIIEQQVI